jgi:hypothetical protein
MTEITTQPGPVESLIRRARQRITDPANFCQGVLARDVDHLPVVDPLAPYAVAWCHNGAYVAEGAYERCIYGLRPLLPKRDGQRFYACLRVALRRGPDTPVTTLSDRIIRINNFQNKRLAHAAVLRLMDRTAEHARQKGW